MFFYKASYAGDVQKNGSSEPSNISASVNDQEWQTISIPDLFSFQIPPSLKSENDISKSTAKFMADLKNENPSLRFHHKTMDSSSTEASKDFYTVSINVRNRNDSERKISIKDPLPLSQKKLDEIYELIKAEANTIEKAPSPKQRTKLVFLQKPIITRINGIDSLYIVQELQRENNPIVKSSKYTFLNYDKEINILINYRSEDSKTYEHEINQFISSFKFFDRSSMNNEIPSDALVIECRRKGGHLYVPVKLSGKKGEIETYMMFDSGASMMSLPEAMYNKIQTKTSSKTIQFATANGMSKMRISNITVNLGGVERNVEVAILKKSDEGLFGLNFFEGLNFVVDMQRSKIYIWEKSKTQSDAEFWNIW